MVKKYLIAIMLIILFIISGCNLSGNIIADDIKENNTEIKIGGLFHLTGEGAFLGESEMRAAQLAVDEINNNNGINGKKLKIIIEDSQTDFKQTTNSITKLKNVNNVDIIIGPTWFGQIAAPIAQELDILMLSPSTGVVPTPNNNFFSLWPTEEQETKSIAEYMKKQNVKKIIMIYSLNDWSQSMKKNFEKEAKLNNIKIEKIYATDPFENNFKTLLEKIKLQDFDAIYAPFAFYPAQGEFSKQLKQQQLNYSLYSSSGTENAVLLESYPQIEDTIYPYPAKESKEEQFVKKYIAKYNSYPAPSAAYAYDAVYLIAQALRQNKTTPKEISRYLKNINYKGISNNISFDENERISHKNFIIKQVKNGEFVNIK